MLINYLRGRKFKDAEEQFDLYRQIYQREDWTRKTLKQLDSIPATMEGKVKDDMETAVRMLKLADAYWILYRKHYGSEGVSRGQELHQKAYDLLCERLGPWSPRVKGLVVELCYWDISDTERRKLVDRFLAYLKQHNKVYNTLDNMVVQQLVRCCLRNNDYGDNVKAIQTLYFHRQSQKSRESDFSWDLIYRPLFSIHLGRREWDEAESLVRGYLKMKSGQHVEVEVYADLGEIQIRRGKVAEGKATLLHKGTAVDAVLWNSHLSCSERLMDLYMQQERWHDAEELGLYLIDTREQTIRGPVWERKSYGWVGTTQKAAQIIEMNWWRTYESSDNEKVYYLHSQYKNKHQLAVVYMQLKQYSEAQRLLEELMEDKLHMDNPILIASKVLLVTVYVELGKLDLAETMQKKIIERMTERFGYDSEKLIPALEKLVDIYEKSNHLGKRHHVKLRLLRYR